MDDGYTSPKNSKRVRDTSDDNEPIGRRLRKRPRKTLAVPDSDADNTSDDTSPEEVGSRSTSWREEMQAKINKLEQEDVMLKKELEEIRSILKTIIGRITDTQRSETAATASVIASTNPVGQISAAVTQRKLPTPHQVQPISRTCQMTDTGEDEVMSTIGSSAPRSGSQAHRPDNELEKAKKEITQLKEKLDKKIAENAQWKEKLAKKTAEARGASQTMTKWLPQLEQMRNDRNYNSAVAEKISDAGLISQWRTLHGDIEQFVLKFEDTLMPQDTVDKGAYRQSKMLVSMSQDSGQFLRNPSLRTRFLQAAIWRVLYANIFKPQSPAWLAMIPMSLDFQAVRAKMDGKCSLQSEEN